MPIIPGNSQPYLVPSISRANLPSGPLTPFQQFNINCRKSKNKEPKYNRSQPDHPDSQSLLRTRTRQAINSNFSSFLRFFWTFTSLELTNFLLSFQFFTLFQVTMPRCQKIYPKRTWHVFPEWHGLNFDSALLTKI